MSPENVLYTGKPGAQPTVSVPGMPKDQVHQVCPYPNGTRGNIDVPLVVE